MRRPWSSSSLEPLEGFRQPQFRFPATDLSGRDLDFSSRWGDLGDSSQEWRSIRSRCTSPSITGIRLRGLVRQPEAGQQVVDA